ncbi:MAG: thioether cross-link-forming SCIFF peptide maturase [Lachnospiraceae bacterium]|mgnify:CR=1 FL=1|uniref:Thioether cross-link-forming SCIFF peptide maturase n=1 Tax=Hominisplanchenecus murintestinalis TaxID=2941517 RepID=A0AC61QZW6_9FIRM|nr:thioether cross-link-forming SCIFF peptide maturase [Hominisplanchenecus murintestinalis]MCI9516297.1 thioether cross-link-forming SCIFF peptide maturase [Lachnospiraceae bacterium]RKJ95743.1 thioether cross-link-forming SCIFF peptide maturase [Anaerotruncus sp. 1XD22-93]MCI9660758.1 thioether cross-link-forming SCIFF peptide maturase [Lachnospiraceae bacterium]NBH97743.1 thioether cross-link-forming SCIFF peptide maturase [Lachnospiraceae bacterium]NBI74799.1 thioether cross-link-forming S
MIHQYRSNGYNIVMDINSGAVHIVDDVVYDVLPLLEEKKREEDILAVLSGKYSEEAVREALSECRELEEAGVLFTEDVYENAIENFSHRPTVVKALCLHIAHDCNLACRYCFAEEGEYHGRRALMSFEVGKQALDFLIANSGNRRNLEVDFFGGEPLMNWQVVKDLVKYGREQEKKHGKNFRFTLTTNGVLLDDEVMEFCNREMANVVLSIDGRKEVHDFMRPFRKGKGSYDLIVPKFRKFAESRNQDRYYVRGTFTRHNLDFAKDVLHLADLGFKQISVEPVVALPEEEYALREEDIPQICEEYDRLAAEMIKRHREGKEFNFFHFMIDLTGGPCVYKRLSGCGSGTEYLAVTPWGDFYPCHQFVGEEAFLMGNVFDGLKASELQEEFKGCNVYAKEKCRNCFAKFYCSGGCAANAYKFHGSINDAYDVGCELQRKRIECAVMIKAALAEEDEKEK